MSTRYFTPEIGTQYMQGVLAKNADSGSTPIYQQVLSWVLVIPLLFFAVYGQFSFLNHSNSALMTNNGDLLQTSQGVRPEAVSYYAFMAALFLAGYRQVWRVVLRNKFLMLAPLLAVVSAVWSESPLFTLRGSLELTITTLFAFYLSERFSTEHLMKLVMLTGTVAAMLSILLVFLAPQYGIYLRDGSGAWQGIFNHKNGLGLGMAFLLTPVFFSEQRLSLKLGYSALLLFLIGMSQSRGAWFVTLGAFGFAGWLSLFRRLRAKESLLLGAVTIAAVGTMVVLGFSNLDPLMKFIGKDPTLTGRTEIYRAVMESILKRPFLGYGYNAFWHGLNHESLIIGLRINWMSIGYAENGFLELCLWFGAVGLGLALLYFGMAITQGAWLLHSPYYTPRVGWFCLIIFLELIANIEAGVVMAPLHIDWVLTLVAFVGLADEVRKDCRAVVSPRPA